MSDVKLWEIHNFIRAKAQTLMEVMLKILVFWDQFQLKIPLKSYSIGTNNNVYLAAIIRISFFDLCFSGSRQRSLSHCHLRERNFDQKGYPSGSTAPILAWSESLWLLPSPETQIPPQSSSFWNCGQHTKGRDRPAEGTSTIRLQALLPGLGATSPAVCGFPRELLWRE